MKKIKILSETQLVQRIDEMRLIIDLYSMDATNFRSKLEQRLSELSKLLEEKIQSNNFNKGVVTPLPPDHVDLENESIINPKTPDQVSREYSNWEASLE